jgi:hypothetical protein
VQFYVTRRKPECIYDYEKYNNWINKPGLCFVRQSVRSAPERCFRRSVSQGMAVERCREGKGRCQGVRPKSDRHFPSNEPIGYDFPAYRAKRHHVPPESQAGIGTRAPIGNEIKTLWRGQSLAGVLHFDV